MDTWWWWWWWRWWWWWSVPGMAMESYLQPPHAIRLLSPPTPHLSHLTEQRNMCVMRSHRFHQTIGVIIAGVWTRIEGTKPDSALGKLKHEPPLPLRHYDVCLNGCSGHTGQTTIVPGSKSMFIFFPQQHCIQELSRRVCWLPSFVKMNGQRNCRAVLIEFKLVKNLLTIDQNFCCIGTSAKKHLTPVAKWL